MSAHESMEHAEHAEHAAGENRKIALLIAVIALCLALSETLGKGAQTESISKNVEAWLRRPTLGTVPLFMAGDKAYFHYLKKTKAQLGVELSFLCENLFERTDFKTGFAGVAPFHDPDHVYTQPISSKVKILEYYAREFVANPKYFNASLLDSAKAFAFYQQEMPSFRWAPVMSVQSDISVLAFTREDRAAPVQIQPRTLSGSLVTVTIAPRQADQPVTVQPTR